MSCYKPLCVCQILLYNREVGKIWNYYDKELNPDGVVSFSQDVVERRIYKTEYGRSVYNPSLYSQLEFKKIFVRCGRCSGCLVSKARDWSVRLYIEYKNAECKDDCYFMTFTYDDEHIPFSDFDLPIEDYTGIFEYGIPTLRFDDLLHLHKSLRNYQYRNERTNVRFYSVGEYGTLSGRPHYHSIVFNFPLELSDKDIISTKSGYPLYKSDVLSNFWDKGFVSVQPLNFANLCYVAGYVNKKEYLKIDGMTSYEAYGQEAPRAIMSRRPGIGMDFEIVNKLPFITNYAVYNGDKTMQFSLPSYYWNRKFNQLVDSDGVVVDEQGLRDFYAVKEQRSNFLEDSIRRFYSNPEELRSYQEYLDTLDDIKTEKIKKGRSTI